MNPHDRKIFDALFAPKVIALVGASSDARKHTSRPQRALRRHGYKGTIAPINPKRDNVFGDTAYPSISAVPHQVDHAFIMVPAASVAAAVDDCIQAQVPVATIYTDGFAETGDSGRQAQEVLVERARAGGVRLLGPNCSGILSTTPSCALSVNAAIEQLDVTPGPLAIISQSGSMTGGLLSRGLGRGVGFSRVVSIGNESDLTVGELTDLLVDDPATGAVLLFLETIRDPLRLAAAARRAVEIGKPIIVYKLGKSDVGRSLAASHTGALASTDDVADAFFKANGILRVDNLETLFELPAMLAGQRPASRHRVAVMSTTGGGAATVVDRLGTLGIDVVAPSEQVVEALAEKGIAIPTGALTDLTHAGTRAEVYGAVLEELVASDHCDLVLAIAGSSAQFQPEISVEPIVRASGKGKPIATFLAPHAAEGLSRLSEAGVAGFRTPESCADAIHAWSRWTSPAAPAIDTTRTERVQAVLESWPDLGTNEFESSKLFAALGIPTAESVVLEIASIDERRIESPVGYPVVAKILSSQIPHKTEAGGVVLGIENAADLTDAVRRIRTSVSQHHPDAQLDGILVQRMERGLVEVILGYRVDPEVGPVVLLGVGGILAELYKDVAIRVAPVDLDEAHNMIGDVKGLAVVNGYRNLPTGDLAALAQAVVSLSRLATLKSSPIAEAEINPLLILPDGVIAVDGLVIAEGGTR